MLHANDKIMHFLNQLIGREAVIEGRHLRVVDVLREDASLVLSEVGSTKMQESLYGQARRRSPRHFQVSLCSEIGQKLHPVAQKILSHAEQEQVLTLLLAQ